MLNGNRWGEAAMKKPSESRLSTGPQHWSTSGRPGVSEYIRAAERFLQARNYTQALEQLTQAQSFEPGNKYIGAIIERVLTLQRSGPAGPLGGTTIPSSQDEDAARYLSLTVGNSFENGIRPMIPAPTEKDYADLIREFIRIAQGYAKLGLPEAAFDALMKAYLLDPVSPDVVACEKIVVPLWQNARKQMTGSAARPVTHEQKVDLTRPPSQRGPLSVSSPGHVTPSGPANATAETEELRMELLMQQKELERQEREREMWRDASRTPIMFEAASEAQPDAPTDGETPKGKKGFFRRFRRDRPPTENA